ncbi:hypothetical protein ACHAWF_002954 [Thalassiosira exigua]
MEFGPTLFPPIPVTTLTYRRLYCMRFFARPRGCFFFSWASTFGVWPFTLPARASDPWTFPMIASCNFSSGVEVKGRKPKVMSRKGKTNRLPCIQSGPLPNNSNGAASGTKIDTNDILAATVQQIKDSFFFSRLGSSSGHSLRPSTRFCFPRAASILSGAKRANRTPNDVRVDRAAATGEAEHPPGLAMVAHLDDDGKKRKCERGLYFCGRERLA